MYMQNVEHIQKYCLQPQDCWPDILLNMMVGDKRISTVKIESEDVVFSLVPEEIGKHCGIVQHLFFDVGSIKTRIKIIYKTRVRNDPITAFQTPLQLKTGTNFTCACKMDAVLWIGLRRHMEFCFNSLPECFHFPKDLPLEVVPTYLTVPENVVRQSLVSSNQHSFATTALKIAM